MYYGYGIGDFVASFKGESEGHPFRGNQYGQGGTSSESSGEDRAVFEKVSNRIVKRGGYAHVGGPRDVKNGSIIGNREGFFRAEDVFKGQDDAFVIAHPISADFERIGENKKLKGTFVITDEQGLTAYLKKGKA